MRILIVNDDGIKAKGIEVLAHLAKSLGEVFVVAPKEQCSGMSMHVTVRRPMEIEEVNFPVGGVQAYSVDGTPADCTNIGLGYVMKSNMPDVVFSGVNFGYNAGQEILNSGTVGAAMSALLYGVPAVAFSLKHGASYTSVEKYFYDVLDEINRRDISQNMFWNVNFPPTDMNGEVKGIKMDTVPSRLSYYFSGNFEQFESSTGLVFLKMAEKDGVTDDIGTDIGALEAGYISVGKVQNIVL